MSTISSTKAVRGMIGLATVGVFALTGCGPDEVTSTTPPASAAASGGFKDTTAKPSAPASGGATKAAKPTTSAAPTATADTGGGGDDGKVATAGQSFKIGQTAQLPFVYGDTKGTIALTVTTIEAGDPADLASLKLGDQVSGKIPYYIRYTIKNVGSTDLSFSTVDHMTGLLPDGTQGQDVMVIGEFDKCKTDSLPSGFTNGQTAQGCAVVLAPSPAVKITTAQYWGEPFSLEKGLTWK
ncbi:hypothetical protein [Kitasatospora sp. NBC_01266]|uniref:hypothetical protein n=1 Tax=Kitasatospora sp. NBC_01266 TaxID=2903572 RepID=UPI002E37FCA6|nr:hypothetical protein [Kitasatospora sp. NBC_01266]